MSGGDILVVTENMKRVLPDYKLAYAQPPFGLHTHEVSARRQIGQVHLGDTSTDNEVYHRPPIDR